MVITEHANYQIDNLVSYLLNNLKNPDAALHFLDELERIYTRLEENPLQFPESSDDFLRSRGYREAVIPRQNYRAVFRIEEPGTVYITGVFHTLENYVKKVL